MAHSDSICEEKIFQSLYLKHLDDVKNFVYYYSGDSNFSEDTAQETFIRLWKNCKKVPFEKVKSYLLTTAKNLFLDNTRHEKVKLKYRQSSTQRQGSESPQFVMEEKEFRSQLSAAIGALQENQRVVFLMNRIDKMKYREIAEALGISQKAVEKRMHKALIELRKLVKNI